MSMPAPQWSSRFAFLMASIGSAVGLGNLWRFPFHTGQNGGSAFVLIYLAAVALVAYPILMSEFAVGRHRGRSAVGSVRQLALDAGRSGRWSMVAYICLFGAFTVLTTYSVVAGQVLAYALMSFTGEFVGTASAAIASAPSLYGGATSAVMWHTLFMVLSVGVVSAGLRSGIERVVTVLMPLFFVMLALLCVYSLVNGAAAETIAYLFDPDFSAITPAVVLAALGQAFFSIGVGGGLMITYGSFLSREENIGNNAAIIVGSDTLVAVVAGLMIFPIVFAFGLDPALGAGLIFETIPVVFADMPGGAFIGGLFFFLAFIAALTTSIAILIALATVGEEQLGMSRTMSACLFGTAAWIIGTISVSVTSLAGWLDFLSGSLFVPLGGLLIAVFVGWVAPLGAMREELHNTGQGLFVFWRYAIRYLAPVAVVLILILGLDARFNLF